MLTSARLLLPAALLPAAALAFYIYKKDKAEKEPPRLLFKLLGVGALCVIPAGLLNTLLISLESAVFYGSASYEPTEFSGRTVIYYLIQTFLIIGPVEEGLKWTATRLLTAKNKNFNSLFDGIVYCVFTSLGFAAAENVMYVFEYGFSGALIRAVTAVPGHMFFAVIMGYYYSEWHIKTQAKGLEKALADRGFLPPGASRFNTSTPLALSILLPLMTHAFYDFCCSIPTAFSTVLFYVTLLGLYLFCFRRVNRISNEDAPSGMLSADLVLRTYPQTAEALQMITRPRTDADVRLPFSAPDPSQPQPAETYPPQSGNMNPYSQTRAYGCPQEGGNANPYSHRDTNAPQ